MTEWDAVIVGAGPAGCAAAAALLGHLPPSRILLLDKAGFPRDKTCGDGIAGGAIDLVASLGLSRESILDGYSPLNRFRVRSPGGVLVAREMVEPVYVIPRLVFDARLLNEVLTRGVQLVRETVRQLEVRADRVVVNGTWQARVVIGADGAESSVRRAVQVPTNPSGSLAVALRGYGAELPEQGGAQLITMTDQQWPAYAWSFPIGGGMANLGYGQVHREGPISRALLLKSLHQMLPGIEVDPTTLRAHRLPLSTWRPRIDTGRVLLAGDAQSLINPLTGEGIYYALLSGALAGASARFGDGAGRAYRQALREKLGRYLRHVELLARVSRWARLMDAIMRGAAADQRTFDEMVRLGLEDGTITPRLLRAAIRPRNWR